MKKHIPPSCRGCGQELSAQHATGHPARHQVFELVPKLVECTEHQLVSCQCPACGEITRGRLPAEITGSGWGSRLSSLSGALSVVCRDSRRQVDWFISEVIGAPSSLGTVQKHLEEVSAALEPGFEQVHVALQHPKNVVGLDETGWRLGNLPYWIWVTETENQAVYIVREGRRKEFAREPIGESKERILVTDRYNAYGILPREQRQICHAHIKREFTAMAVREGPMGDIGIKLHASSEAFQKAWIEVKSGKTSRGEFVSWMKDEVVRRWLTLLKEAKTLDEKAPGFVIWLLKDAKHVMLWAFLDHEDVEPTNNRAERALRGPVIQRKLSWGSKSEAGLRLMERLWTAAETCRRQGRSLLDYITASMEALRGGRAAPVLVLA
ncbi:IS66 family transposase [Lujinxingia sediminis]|uniref:IS66 family transposase n=1 Tax=Lujinxingia sediminis TaxID=2480984 RepID=A0ABY0CPR9_9DELT|nr:IS66 family transposase [Lujinxingia sediminis]